jgi:hypothetical protein
VQDDVLDCYGAPERIGKIGTDIKDNKCSWLINTALGGASKSQLRVLEANYAKEDPKCEAKVKAVFKDLKLEAKFAACARGHSRRERTAAGARARGEGGGPPWAEARERFGTGGGGRCAQVCHMQVPQLHLPNMAGTRKPRTSS